MTRLRREPNIIVTAFMWSITTLILASYYWRGFHKKHPPQSGFFCWPVIGAGGNILITGGNGKKDAVEHQGCVGHFYLSVNTPAGATFVKGGSESGDGLVRSQC